MTSTSAGTALLNVTALAPGKSATGQVDITNSGDLPAAFTLSAASLVDTPSSPAFSAKADLKVEDLGDPGCSTSCPATSTVYDGKLGALSSVALGTLAAERQAPLPLHRVADRRRPRGRGRLPGRPHHGRLHVDRGRLEPCASSRDCS